MKKYIAMAAVAMMFAACTNDDMPEVPAVDKLTDTPIMVNAGVADLTTRAGMTTDNLTDLGLFITNSANSTYSYTNLGYKKIDDKFIVQGSVKPLWQSATQAVTVVAYSPYNAKWVGGAQEFTVDSYQTTTAQIMASDLLWAKSEVNPSAVTQSGSITYNSQINGIDIQLQHVMSKLVVNISYGDEVAEQGATVTEVTLKDLYTACKFNSDDATFSDLGSQTDIMAYKQTDTRYEAILPPQNAAFSVTLLLNNNRQFVYTGTGTDFKSGYVYTLNLLVGKDKVQLLDGGITVGDWGYGNGGGDQLVTE